MRDLELILQPGGEPSAFFDELAEEADELARTAGLAPPRRAPVQSGSNAAPALTIRGRGCGSIHYLALPRGHQREPLLAALAGQPRQELVELLAGVERAAELEVFIAEACPHCPRAVQAALDLALASRRVGVAIVDVQRFARLAERYALRSAPTAVLDGGLTLVGVHSSRDLAEHILARESPAHAAALFRSLIASGRFAEAARRIEMGEGAAHFLESWLRSTTSERIGLLLAAQAALEMRREALDPIAADLLPGLESEDAALRGDTADLLGQIGHRVAAAALPKLLDDPNPDVAEIAAEALENLR